MWAGSTGKRSGGPCISCANALGLRCAIQLRRRTVRRWSPAGGAEAYAASALARRQKNTPMTTETVSHQREAAFHDAWASSTDLGDVLVRECFEAPTAVENQFILSKMGSLSGKRLLDIGAGLGESSVYFALQGAVVTVVDISPQMVATALDLGKKFGVELEGIVCCAEDLNLPAETYDIIYAANTLHH